MKKEINLVVEPKIAFNEQFLKQSISEEIGLNAEDFSFELVRRSIDARSKTIKVNVKVAVYIQEIVPEKQFAISYKNVSESTKTVVIVGSGPAGLFAALRCLEIGIKPIVIERGKEVRARRRDLADLNKNHLVNPESNYCFGEGGAGTYSDGKLYTRSSKRGDIEKILQTFVLHGAGNDILIDAHPHIGTNKLPKIIETIRERILENGGEFLFEHKLIDIEIQKDSVKKIVIQNQNSVSEFTMDVECLILATGHSARDIYELLDKKGIEIEAKPFAMGVRAEHPQELIDRIQYHCGSMNELIAKRAYLPAASYSLVHQSRGRGVYSFCMCPGGIIAPCATGEEEIVTNGWSPSKRNNPYANSGVVVGFELIDFKIKPEINKALFGLETQKELEKRAWIAGGKTQTAPAQRMLDFINNKVSSSLPNCSYHPGIVSANLHEVLGSFITPRLKEGLENFGKKMKGYVSNESVLVGVESRTSTPVRIPRNPESCEHVRIKGLFPCGEGAGFAGGIVSAAMDGERVVNAISKKN